jgi:hypothetical protein
MIGQPPLELLSLRLGERELIGVGINAIPDLSDQTKPLFNAESLDLGKGRCDVHARSPDRTSVR